MVSFFFNGALTTVSGALRTGTSERYGAIAEVTTNRSRPTARWDLGLVFLCERYADEYADLYERLFPATTRCMPRLDPGERCGPRPGTGRGITPCRWAVKTAWARQLRRVFRLTALPDHPSWSCCSRRHCHGAWRPSAGFPARPCPADQLLHWLPGLIERALNDRVFQTRSEDRIAVIPSRGPSWGRGDEPRLPESFLQGHIADRWLNFAGVNFCGLLCHACLHVRHGKPKPVIPHAPASFPQQSVMPTGHLGKVPGTPATDSLVR